MKNTENKEMEVQGTENQVVEEKLAKFSASATIKAVMQNVERMQKNKLLNKEDGQVINEIMKKVGLRSMGINID